MIVSKKFRLDDDFNGALPVLEILRKTIYSSLLRCKMTTVDPETAELGEEPLQTLGLFRCEDVG